MTTMGFETHPVEINNNATLQVRSALKAGRLSANHSEALQVRSAIKAGRIALNHNEAARRLDDRKASHRG